MMAITLIRLLSAKSPDTRPTRRRRKVSPNETPRRRLFANISGIMRVKIAR